MNLKEQYFNSFSKTDFEVLVRALKKTELCN